MDPEISVVIPVHNEALALSGLFDSLDKALRDMSYEIIFVNDGSTDGSDRVLRERIKNNPKNRAIFFNRNFGQTAAIAAGFEHARGNIVITMDADGQNDPLDIPRLRDAILQGADVACGWRRARHDKLFTRRLPSWFANLVIGRVTGVHLHDFGCTLKAYRRTILQDLRLYGEMHRLIPIWCAWKGARITEVEVRHHARHQGRSHYGLGRTFRVLLDLLTAKFFYSFLPSPSHAVGGVGIFLLVASFFTGLFPILDKFIFQQWGHLRIPFMIFCVFLGLLGMQFLALGVLAEILVRIYYETKAERPYRTSAILPEEQGLQTKPAPPS